MLLITFYSKFCSFFKLIMPKFLSKLNYEESKLNSELHIIRQKKKSSRIQNLRNFARAAKFSNPAKLSSSFLTRLTFLYKFLVFF